MKLWSRLILGGLTLALALSLNVVTADAATSSKKKSSTKKETKKKKNEKKKEAKKEARHSSGESKTFVSGSNTSCRSGLFYGDSSNVADMKKFEGSVNIGFSSPASGWSNIPIQFGGQYGIAKNLELSAAGILSITSSPSYTIGPLTFGGSTSSFALDFGGKYHVAGTNSNSPDFSLGGDVLIPTYTGGQVIFTPRGTITYTTTGGLVLNGDCGVHITNPTTYVSFDAGIGVPVSSKLSVIGEIGANQGGFTASMLAGGVRAALGENAKLQAQLGIPLNGGGVMVGAGLSIAAN